MAMAAIAKTNHCCTKVTYLGVLVERAVSARFELNRVKGERIKDAVMVVQVAGRGHAGHS